MPNIYCPSCGNAIKYLYHKPDECSECKHSFSSIAQVSVPKYKKEKSPVKTPSPEDEDDEDEEEDDYQPFKSRKHLKIKKINVQIDTPLFEKLGSVIGSNPGEVRTKRPGVGKNDYKSKVFNPKPASID
jgi:hypothetical protein